MSKLKVINGFPVPLWQQLVIGLIISILSGVRWCLRVLLRFKWGRTARLVGLTLAVIADFGVPIVAIGSLLEILPSSWFGLVPVFSLAIILVWIGLHIVIINETR